MMVLRIAVLVRREPRRLIGIIQNMAHDRGVEFRAGPGKDAAITWLGGVGSPPTISRYMPSRPEISEHPSWVTGRIDESGPNEQAMEKNIMTVMIIVGIMSLFPPFHPSMSFMPRA